MRQKGNKHFSKWLPTFGSRTLLFMLCLLCCSACAPAGVPVQSIQVAAHRGYSAKYPENTIPAFEAAAQLDIDYLELDVQQTKDHTFVVSHDEDLERTAGVSGNICEMQLADLKSLDVGNWFSKTFKGLKMPTLEDVLTISKKSDKRLIIEIKKSSDERFEEEIIDCIHHHQLTERCLLSSTDYGVLRSVKQYAPEIRTVYLSQSGELNFRQLSAADEISIPYRAVSPEVVKKIHESGKRLQVWTVNSAKKIQSAAELGVDVLITDNPKLALEVLQKSGGSS